MKRKKNKKSKKNFSVVNNRYFLYSIFIFLILLLIGIGVTFSYAFWVSIDKQSNINSVDSGCLSFTYNDKNIEGSVINIDMSNTYPITDNKGLSTTPYVFKITNTCDLSANFNVYLNKLVTADLDSGYIKYYLNDSNDAIVLGPDLVSNLEVNSSDTDIMSAIEKKVGSINSSYLLHSFELAPEDSITLNLRLWIDQDAPNSIMGKSFNAAVSVIAVPKN